MALEADVKKSIIDEYATHPGDTGSPEVQVALLTRRIKIDEKMKAFVNATIIPINGVTSTAVINPNQTDHLTQTPTKLV